MKISPSEIILTLVILSVLFYTGVTRYQSSLVTPSTLPTCTVTDNLVTLYNKNYTNAKLKLTCGNEVFTIDGLNVGRIVYKQNRRVLGLKHAPDDK